MRSKKVEEPIEESPERTLTYVRMMTNEVTKRFEAYQSRIG
ncbi:hypothetical protein [Bacillus sp. HNG]|nr:hypothetical protein [Bacillus sp. HNG]